MAKSNCPAEDSAPPQASAGQLTPRFLPLSLSGRLLQVTVAISPSAAKGASKERFSARIRSEGPHKSRFFLLGPCGWCHPGLVFEDAAEIPGVFVPDIRSDCFDADVRVPEQEFFRAGDPQVSKVLERRGPILFLEDPVEVGWRIQNCCSRSGR